MTREFEDLELIINRNKKWLEEHEKHRFYLSEHLPLINFKLPKELDNLTEEDTPLLRATIRRHWEKFIIGLMVELRENPIHKKGNKP